MRPVSIVARYLARSQPGLQGAEHRIESGPLCCTYVTGVAEQFVARVAGQFADSNTVRVTRTNYLRAEPISVPETFTLVRQWSRALGRQRPGDEDCRAGRQGAGRH